MLFHVVLCSPIYNHICQILSCWLLLDLSGSAVERAKLRVLPLENVLWYPLFKSAAVVVTNTNFHTEWVQGCDPPSSLCGKVDYAQQEERRRSWTYEVSWNAKHFVLGLWILRMALAVKWNYWTWYYIFFYEMKERRQATVCERPNNRRWHISKLICKSGGWES